MLFLSGVCLSTWGQQPVSVRGSVVDRDGPVEFLNALLFVQGDTSRMVTFAISDSLGRFSFPALTPGRYDLSLRLVGYQPKRTSFEVPVGIPTLALPAIEMLPDATLLDAVVVTGQKVLVEKTSQGFVVNAAANISQVGGTATDLLRNTPTVSVDAEGAITLRGKAPLILINGRNSALANPDQIAASSIESIEIINNPNARNDANAESGIINIKLKKNRDNGTNGALAIGTGMGSRGRLSSSFLLNNKTEKWNWGLAYNNRFAGRTRAIDGSRTNFTIPDDYQLNQNRNDVRLEQLQSLKLNADFVPSSRNSFSLEVIGNKEGQDNDESLNSIWLNQTGNFGSKSNRHSLEFGRSEVLEGSFNFNRSFTNERKSLSAGLTSALYRDRENTDITSRSLSEGDSWLGDPFLQRTHNYENGRVSNARIDVQLPMGTRGQFETGYKGIYRSLTADYLTADFLNATYVANPKASSVYEFAEQVDAVYGQYNSYLGDKENPRIKYLGGLRVEDVSNEGKVVSTDATFSNDYTKLFPTAEVTWYTSHESFWKAGYSKRINRPGFGQLNPFNDITDSLNQHSGNPNLKPEIIHALELAFNRQWNLTAIAASLFYRYSTNTIRPYTELKPNGVTLLYPINIGTAELYGIESVLTTKLSNYYDLNSSLSLFQQKLDGSNVSPDAVNNALGWYGKIINNFSPGKSLKIQLIANYNSAVATPQGRRIEQYFVDMGFQQKLGKGNARLGLVVTDMFNTLKSGVVNETTSFRNYRNSKADTRALMLTFAYSFRSSFKEGLMENKFSREY
jgi:outer membrane receptor protein involved in Fe transport